MVLYSFDTVRRPCGPYVARMARLTMMSARVMIVSGAACTKGDIMRITLCVALLLALAVPVMAQAEWGASVKIVGLTYIQLAKPIGNALYLLVQTINPTSGEYFYIHCRATGPIKHKIEYALRDAYYNSCIYVQVRIQGHMRNGSYANFWRLRTRQPKYGIVVIIKHIEFDYENATISAGR